MDDACDIADTAQDFCRVWANDTTLNDIAKHLTRTEAQALADLYISLDMRADADRLLCAWIEAEVEDGEIEHGTAMVIRGAIVLWGEKEEPDR